MAAIRRAAPCDVPALLGLVESYWRLEGIDGFDPAPVARALEQLLGEGRLGAAWVGCINISLQVGRHNHDGAVFYSRHGYGERASYRLLEKSPDRAR